MKYNPQIHHRRSIRLKGYDYSQGGAYFITICCENREYRFGKIIVGAGFTPALDENGQPELQIGQPELQIGQPELQIGQPQGIAPTDARNADARMELNEYGQIAYNEWIKLSKRFLNFDLDVFQIMPNHMHGIILLNNVGAGFTPAQNNSIEQNNVTNENVTLVEKGAGAGVNPAPTTNATVGDIVGAYKSLVANGCLDIYKTKNKTMGKLWQRNYYEHIIRDEQSYQNISEYIINNPAKWKDDKFFNE